MLSILLHLWRRTRRFAIELARSAGLPYDPPEADVPDMRDREMLRLILAGIRRLEYIVSSASDYMASALADLDSQLGDLQTRLGADAQALQDAIEAANLSAGDSAALTAAAERVRATADLVSGLAQPSAVADETQPDVTVTPLPPTEDTPPVEPTGEPTDTPVTTDPTTQDPAQSVPPEPTV